LLSVSTLQARSHSVLGAAPMNRNTWRIGTATQSAPCSLPIAHRRQPPSPSSAVICACVCT
jgi:hypothetical protein